MQTSSMVRQWGLGVFAAARHPVRVLVPVSEAHTAGVAQPEIRWQQAEFGRVRADAGRSVLSFRERIVRLEVCSAMSRGPSSYCPWRCLWAGHADCYREADVLHRACESQCVGPILHSKW